MTRRFEFDNYKIVFNKFHFKGAGYLLGLPYRPDVDMHGGRVSVCSRPPELSYTWLHNIANERRVTITVHGVIEGPDGSLIRLQNGVLSSHTLSPNSLGFYDFIFTFEVIDPPL